MTTFTIIERLDEILALLKGKKGNVWMDMKEAVQYAKLSKSTLMRGIQKGTLRSTHRKGKRLFRISWIDKWLQNG